MTEPLHLRPISSAEKDSLWDMLQMYLSELSPYYGDRANEQGQYPYPYFENYFSGADRRAYFLSSGEHILGFALLNRHSPLGRNIDWAMAEFYITPAHRRKGLARQAAKLLFRAHPGRWELKFSRENSIARYFWLSVTHNFRPEHTLLPEGEEVLSFAVAK